MVYEGTSDSVFASSDSVTFTLCTALASTSAVLKQVVDSLPAATTTRVATSGSPSQIHQPVTVTVTIASTYGPIPNGETVTFYDGTSAIGTGFTAGGTRHLR